MPVIFVSDARVYKFSRFLGKLPAKDTVVVPFGQLAVHDAQSRLIGFAVVRWDSIDGINGSLYAEATIDYATPERLSLETEPDRWTLFMDLDTESAPGQRVIKRLILQRAP